MARKAVVLFNLGGPDSLAAVEPFLFNLFYDPAIIRVPKPFRYLIAKLISKRRAPIAQEIYQHLGGKSPLLEQTERQAQLLEELLDKEADEFRVFIAMRYWNPRAEATVEKVKEYNPDEIILLPLYPQLSSTTTGSSVEEWKKLATAKGLAAQTSTICCYPDESGFVQAYADLIDQGLEGLDLENTRVLFSAHGLPKKIVDGGDPYPEHVQKSVSAIVAKLKSNLPDYLVSYQSRVGPVEWIGPDTEDEIKRAGEDGKSLVIVPVAFVSEHSETLVELDIEYGELAKEVGIETYVRIPTVSDHPLFIQGLADIVAARATGQTCPHNRTKQCSASATCCLYKLDKRG